MRPPALRVGPRGPAHCSGGWRQNPSVPGPGQATTASAPWGGTGPGEGRGSPSWDRLRATRLGLMRAPLLSFPSERPAVPHQGDIGSWLPAAATLAAQTLHSAWPTGEAALGFVWPLSPAELGLGAAVTGLGYSGRDTGP